MLALKLGRSSNATKLVSNPNREAEAQEAAQAVQEVCFKNCSVVVLQEVVAPVVEAAEVLQASSMTSSKAYSPSSTARARLQEARRRLTR